MDPTTVEQLQAIAAMLQDAWAKSGGNRLLLLPWAALALVQVYKLGAVQAFVAARWPNLAWGNLKLGWQMLLAFVVGFLPVLAAQLLGGVSLVTALVLAGGAGLTAVLAYKPLKAVTGAVAAPLADRLSPGARAALGIVVPLKAQTPAVEAPPTAPAANGFITPRALVLAALVGCGIVAGITAIAQAQTVYSQQRAAVRVLDAVSCTAAAGSRWTDWINVATQRALVFDIDFVDADASAANLSWRCETSQVNTTTPDDGRDLPVITATSAAGISTLMQASWAWVSTAGLAPGTGSVSTTIGNIPAPWLECLFTCGAGAGAADTITVFARGVTP